MLKRGTSKNILAYNIKKEVESGKPVNQASAIAYSMAEKSKKKKAKDDK